MLRTAMQRRELGELLNLLYKVFDIRITFFEADGEELDIFQIKEMCDYCATRRQDTDFNRRCVECDRRNLSLAKESGGIYVYRCHAGLIEGVVPLSDDRGHFLGAIIFGQLREEDRKTPAGLSRKLVGSYKKIPASSMEHAGHIAKLLQHTSETIIRNQLVRYRSPNWAEELEGFLAGNLDQKITIADMADYARRSPSYISHYFKTHFGTSPSAYIRNKRLELARELLASDMTLAQIADKCGFYDEFHMSKAFKKLYSVSPRKFRQEKCSS